MVQTNSLAAELLDIALNAAKSAGELLSKRPKNLDVTQKTSIVDFATQMDKASENLIVNQILGARPDDGILAEEGSSVSGSSGITWIIDPLDGTVNYFYDLPAWNVSIAAADENGALVGVVYSPSIGSLWTGIRGQGSFHNGEKIKTGNETNLQKSLVLTGFSYDLVKRVEQSAILEKMIPQVRDIRRFGSAAVDLCFVAMGKADAYYEYGLQPWDRAAGALIAREAGAIISNWEGAEPDYEMVICANPALHQILITKLQGIRGQVAGEKAPN